MSSLDNSGTDDQNLTWDPSTLILGIEDGNLIDLSAFADPDDDWKISGNNIYSGLPGNVGIGTNAPSQKLHVVGKTFVTGGASAPYSPFPNSIAAPSAGSIIYGNNTANAGGNNVSYGVYGSTQSDTYGSAGVAGISTAFSNNEIGVLGDYDFFGSAVLAIGWDGDWMPAFKDYGVYASLDYDDGHAVHGTNTDLSASAAAVYAQGNLIATGAKNASVPTSKGNQLLYSMESPEVWFEDLGFAELVNGEVTIHLDNLFLETVVIDESHPMHVFVQEQGECNELYVIPGTTSFTVKEKNNGSSNVRFSYRVLAKRTNYQDHRFGMDNYFGYGDTRDQFEYVPPFPVEPEVVKERMEQAFKEKELKALEMKKAREAKP